MQLSTGEEFPPSEPPTKPRVPHPTPQPFRSPYKKRPVPEPEPPPAPPAPRPPATDTPLPSTPADRPRVPRLPAVDEPTLKSAWDSAARLLAGRGVDIDKVMGRAADAIGKFEQRARAAWDDDSIELSDEDERHIDVARERVLSFAKDQALLDWLDAPEPNARARSKEAWRDWGNAEIERELAPWPKMIGGSERPTRANPIIDGTESPPSSGTVHGVGDVLEVPDLSLATGPQALVSLAPAIERAAGFAKNSRAEATLVVYERKWENFVAWCAGYGLPSLPTTPEVITTYLGERVQTWGVQSLRQALSAISHYHKKAGGLSPCHAQIVVDTFDGIKREKGVAPKRQAYPLTPEMLRQMIEAMPWALASARDRAVLCLGFSAALRRSEIVALDVYDLDFVEDGIAVLVRKSKTDQEAVGETVGVGYGQNRLTCPVRAVRDWIGLSRAEGRLFRSLGANEPLDKRGKDITRIVKRAAKRAGFDPVLIEKLSAHSLRAGFATTAAEKKVSLYAIARQGRWKKYETVKGYVRNIDSFTEASSGLGM